MSARVVRILSSWMYRQTEGVKEELKEKKNRGKGMNVDQRKPTWLQLASTEIVFPRVWLVSVYR